MKRVALVLLAACSRGGGAKLEAPPAELAIVADVHGLSADDADAVIAGPITQALARQDGIAHVSATSDARAVRVSAWIGGEDAERTATRIRDAIEAIERQLPDGVMPSIERRVRGPAIRAIVRGDHFAAAELRTWADYTLRLAAMQTPGVRDADACGGAIARVDVVVDPARLAAYGLGVDQVADALVGRDVVVPSADAFVVRGLGPSSIDGLRATPLPGGADAAAIHLDDVAAIEETAAPDPCDAPAPDGAVVVDVRLGADADAVAVAQALRAAARTAPQGMTVQLVHPPARYAIALAADAGTDLRALAAAWRGALAAAPGVLAVERAPGVTTTYTIDHAQLARLGVAPRAAATALEVAAGGAEAATLYASSARRSIYVTMRPADAADLGRVTVLGNSGPVAIAHVVHAGTAPARVDRFDLAPAMILHVAIAAGDDADAIAGAAIDRARTAAPPPAGVRVTAWREP